MECRSHSTTAAGAAAAVFDLSVMHFRYGIAADLIYELLPDLRAAAAAAPQSLSWPNASTHQCMDTAAAAAAERGRRGLSGLVAVAVWLRFSALRLLTWNHNYNVKPREISAALHRLGASLVEVSVISSSVVRQLISNRCFRCLECPAIAVFNCIEHRLQMHTECMRCIIT